MFERTGDGLGTAIMEVESMRNDALPRLSSSLKITRFNIEWADTLEARNMLGVAEMSMKRALMRTETKGLHERADYPNEEPLWLRQSIASKEEKGTRLTTEPVTFPQVKPAGLPDTQLQKEVHK
jgi:succinate dehydrogenase / fumarate reductase flavoprotein subunit